MCCVLKIILLTSTTKKAKVLIASLALCSKDRMITFGMQRSPSDPVFHILHKAFMYNRSDSFSQRVTSVSREHPLWFLFPSMFDISPAEILQYGFGSWITSHIHCFQSESIQTFYFFFLYISYSDIDYQFQQRKLKKIPKKIKDRYRKH